MGFQYAAKSRSSARPRSAASPLRAAARTERRVWGNDSPGADIGNRAIHSAKSLRRVQRRWQANALVARTVCLCRANYAGTGARAFCAPSMPLLMVVSQSAWGTEDFAAA